MQPNSPGVSKSNVSRHWQSVGHQFVDALRGKDLSDQDWVVLMLDGIRFRAETDQATRWLAFALTAVEKSCHRISGYKDLPCLMSALERKREREIREHASRRGPLPSPSAPATAKAPAKEVENQAPQQ